MLNVPVFRVSGAANTTFLHTITSTKYNGKPWTIDDDLMFTSLEDPTFQSRVAGFDSVAEDSVTLTPITRFGAGFIPTALNVSALLFPAPLLSNSGLVSFRSTEAISESYGFTASSYAFNKAMLLGPSVLPDSRYLQLPCNISDRAGDLARG